VRASQAGPVTGLVGQVLLLAVLGATAGLGTAAWIVGVACALTMAAALAVGRHRQRARHADDPARRAEPGGRRQDGEQQYLADQPGHRAHLTRSHLPPSKIVSTGPDVKC